MADLSRTSEELGSAHHAGDVGRLERLILSHQVSLRGMCWNYLRDHDAVEDVLQDTFCQLLERIPWAQGGEVSASAWAHRIAANLCIDELRRRARRARAHVEGVAAELALLDAADPDRSMRPDAALEAGATRELVRVAICRLPQRQREVLLLRDVLGRSEAQTASSLGISSGSVQGLLHRAREAFREAYVGLVAGERVPVECRDATFVLEHLQLGSLRKDRRRVVERHLRQCPRCRAHFGAAGAGHLSPEAAAA